MKKAFVDFALAAPSRGEKEAQVQYKAPVQKSCINVHGLTKHFFTCQALVDPVSSDP